MSGMRGTQTALLLLGLALSCVVAPQAARAQDVSMSVPERREADPGSVVSLPVRVLSGAPRMLRIDPALPPGWSILIPPAAMRAGPGRPATRIVSIQIPASAAAGAWRVSFRLRQAQSEDEGVLAGAETVIEVAEQTEVDVSLVEAVSRVRAGAPIAATLAVENTGNHTATFQIIAESSLGYDVRVSSGSVELAPAARAEISVSARSRDDLVNELEHVLRVTAQPPGGDTAAGEARVTTQIVPVRRQARQLEEGRLPVLFTSRATTESGVADFQAELDLPATRIGGRVVAARLRGPDMRSSASFGERDEYAASVEGERVGLRMGDQNYQVSDLLDTSFFGFGSEVSYDRERLQGTAFVSRTRHVFPETERAGGGVQVWPHRRFAVGVSALARGEFEPGEAASVAARWLAVDGTELSAEVAHGQYDVGKGNAVQISAQGSLPWIVFSGRAEAADPFFLGGIQNSERVQGSFAVRGSHWIRLEGLGRAERRFFDAERSADRALENRLFRGGAGASFAVGGARLQAMLLGQFQDRRVQQTGLDRAEESVMLRVNFNRRGFGINAAGEAGRIDDAGFAEGTFSSVRGSAFKVLGSWSLSLTASYLEGVTFFSPTNQERVTIGSTLSYDAGRGLSASASAFQSRESGTFSQTFTLFDARIAADLWSSHELEFRARGSQTSFSSDVRTGTFSLAYRIPFTVRAPFTGPDPDTVISLRVRDEETGEPLEGVVFSAGRVRAETDSEGRAELIMPGEERFILLDQESIGLSRMPTLPFPLEVDEASPRRVDVGIVQAARLTATITTGRENAALNAALGRGLDGSALSGLVVEARSGDMRFRRLTDGAGRAQFPPLVPGTWEVSVLERTLPDEYRTDPAVKTVTLIPGGVGEAVLRLEPTERRIRFVTSGAGVAVSVSASGEPGAAARPGAAAEDSTAATPEVADQEAVRVKEGDTLFVLARRHYASQWHWIRIWQANRDVLRSPDVLPLGARLVLPARGPLSGAEWEAIRRLAGQ